MSTERRLASRSVAVVFVVLAALVLAVWWVGQRQGDATAGSERRTSVSPPVSTRPATADRRVGSSHHRSHAISLDLTAHSTTDPASIWVVVNKSHPIRPLDYRPAVTLVRGYQVARPAARPLTRLLRAGDASGLGLKIASAFRSYAYQAHVHALLVASEGTVAADRASARPGHSEHQTGLAVDLTTPAHPRCDFEACFAGTPAGHWLARHAWRYGFIVRYTAENQRVTGYEPEPWHIRYVGRALAAAMRRAGVTTLEQVFHLGR